jgi:hypothetical protein
VPNCVAGGRLLRTDENYECCVRILAQIVPKSFKVEFRVFLEESGVTQRSQSKQLKDLLRLYADEYLIGSERSIARWG